MKTAKGLIRVYILSLFFLISCNSEDEQYKEFKNIVNRLDSSDSLKKNNDPNTDSTINRYVSEMSNQLGLNSNNNRTNLFEFRNHCTRRRRSSEHNEKRTTSTFFLVTLSTGRSITLSIGFSMNRS